MLIDQILFLFLVSKILELFASTLFLFYKSDFYSEW